MSITRRVFLRRTGIATGTAFFISRYNFGESANEKLNIGVIGVANQGNYNLQNVASENIVALCDVDENYLAKPAAQFPNAKKYNDFRRLIDQKDLDAIVVATPDHTHAVATLGVLESGRHAYCEKPLTHTVSECREIQKAAKKSGKATQIGTQIHAGDNYRRVVELVQYGAIGPVKEVHVWASAAYGGMEMPKDFPPVPKELHYDLWLGPVKPVSYHPDWCPFKWRNWWHFGGGALGDFGCHFMDLPHWALGLRTPVEIEAEGPPVDEHCPPTTLIVRYLYPARGEQPPVKLTWYHGGKKPSILTEEQAKQWNSGVLFVGERGNLLSDYGRHVLLPEDKFRDFARPAPFIANSIGHHKEWIEACKGRGGTTCNFDYSGALTESVLLGNVAYRTGEKIIWDTKKLKATNTRKAEEFIHHDYRKGWKL